MPFPSSDLWDLFHFQGSDVGELLSLIGTDVQVLPLPAGPEFAYSATGLRVRSDGSSKALNLIGPIGNRSSTEWRITPRSLPPLSDPSRGNNLIVTMVSTQGGWARVGISTQGISLVSDGTHYLVPDTARIVRSTFTLRLAMDSDASLLYVMAGAADPALILTASLEESPATETQDRAGISVSGTGTDVTFGEIKGAGTLVLPKNQPVAEAGSSLSVHVGEVARLDGRKSTGKGSLQYDWKLVGVPHDSGFVTHIPEATTAPDTDGLVFTISMPSVPATTALGDVLLFKNQTHIISRVGPGIITVESETLPAGETGPAQIISQASFIGTSTPNPYIVPDVAGPHRIHLRVSDGDVWSASDELVLTVRDAGPATGIEPRLSNLWKMLGSEWDYVEGREVFENFWTSAGQLVSSLMLKLWQYHYNTSLRDIQDVFQHKWQGFPTLKEMGGTYRPVHPVLTTYDISTLDPGSAYPLELRITSTGRVVSLNGAPSASEFATLLRGEGIDAHTFGRLGGPGSTVVAGLSYVSPNTYSVSLPFDPSPGSYLLINGSRFEVQSYSAGNVTFDASSLPPGQSVEATVFIPVGVTVYGVELVSDPEGYFQDPLPVLGGIGSLWTTRSYRVEGVDLRRAGVRVGDYLVLNNGQMIKIDGITAGGTSEIPNSTITVDGTLPSDATAEWVIPTVATLDDNMALLAAYPSDLLMIRNGAEESGYHVYGVNGFDVAIDTPSGGEIYAYQHMRGLLLPERSLSVPTVQDRPLEDGSEKWSMGEDFRLVPFFRTESDDSYPVLLFNDGIFSRENLPPEVIWAETLVVSNNPNIESNFGPRAGLMEEDLPEGISYRSAVSGMIYSRTKGPTISALETGTHILLGNPVTSEAGTVILVDSDYSPSEGQIYIRRESDPEVVDTYTYRKDDSEVGQLSGLSVVEGQKVPAFHPLMDSISVVDIYRDDSWVQGFVREQEVARISALNTFLVRADLSRTDITNLSAVVTFLTNTKPAFTNFLLLGDIELEDEIDLDDDLTLTAQTFHVDSLSTDGRAHIADDIRPVEGHWTFAGDGGAYIGEIYDLPHDTIEFDLTWTTVASATPDTSIITSGETVTDIDGTQGPSGGTFIYGGGNLPAGSYLVTKTIKVGKQFSS